MGLADALGPVGPQTRTVPVLEHPGAQAPRRSSAHAPASTPLPLQGTAKSKHPDFAAVKVYLRKKTRREAERKFQDGGGEDLSALVELLLQKYVSA